VVEATDADVTVLVGLAFVAALDETYVTVVVSDVGVPLPFGHSRK